MDNVEIAHLAQHDTEDGEYRDADDGANVSEQRRKRAPILDDGNAQEEHGGEQHAHAGDPIGGSAVLIHKQLGARSRKPPAHSSYQREHHAAHHMLTLHHRRLRHVFPFQASCLYKMLILTDNVK